MNKVLILKEKYPKIQNKTFDFFDINDVTETKKFLPYYLKIWSDKNTHASKEQLVDYVNQFNELLPYINNKDIYSKYYDNFFNLISTVNEAQELKIDKSFNRKEHIVTLKETNDYILLSPKTYVGSLKYGASTKWCTAFKEPKYFSSYTKDGYLVYLIDKKKDKKKNYEKVAFYMKKSKGNELQTNFEIYNAIDVSVDVNSLVNGNWGVTLISELIIEYRLYSTNQSLIEKVKQYVGDVMDNILKIDIDELMNNLKFLEQQTGSNYSDEKNTVLNFVDTINKKLNDIN